MDIAKIATQLLAQKMGGANASEGQIQNALQGLIGGGSDGLNIGELVGKFSQNGGLANQLQSWLGDGANEGLSVDNVKEVFGGQQVQQFASQLGVDEEQAAGSLADMIPQLIDKSSSGGNLLDAVGGIGGALNMAKGLFNK